MDRARILRVAQEKQLKKDVEVTAGSSVGMESPKEPTVSVSSAPQKRPLEPTATASDTLTISSLKKRKSSAKRQGFSLVDEPIEEGMDQYVDLTEVEAVGDPKVSEGGKVPETGVTIPEKEQGTEQCTLLKFHSGRGWLGKGSKVPLDALGAFALSPDKEKLRNVTDEEAFRQVKESLGVLGSRVLDVVERAEKCKDRAAVEHRRALSEQDAKEAALRLAKESKEKEENLTKDLSTRDEELRVLKVKLKEMEESRDTERATCNSLRTEVDSLRAEVKVLKEKGDKNEQDLKKATEALEKVEQEALITYKDCVEKFQASSEFEDILYEKAGAFHEGGFNDCLRFVGAGNVVDPAAHSVENFRAMELAALAQEQAKAQKGDLPESSKGGEISAEGGNKEEHSQVPIKGAGVASDVGKL